MTTMVSTKRGCQQQGGGEVPYFVCTTNPNNWKKAVKMETFDNWGHLFHEGLQKPFIACCEKKEELLDTKVNQSVLFSSKKQTCLKLNQHLFCIYTLVVVWANMASTRGCCTKKKKVALIKGRSVDD